MTSWAKSASGRLEQPIAIVRRQDLGVRDAGHVAIGIEDDRGRDDRPGETPPTDFVHAGDVHEPEPADVVLD